MKTDQSPTRGKLAVSRSSAICGAIRNALTGIAAAMGLRDNHAAKKETRNIVCVYCGATFLTYDIREEYSDDFLNGIKTSCAIHDAQCLSNPLKRRLRKVEAERDWLAGKLWDSEVCFHDLMGWDRPALKECTERSPDICKQCYIANAKIAVTRGAVEMWGALIVDCPVCEHPVKVEIEDDVRELTFYERIEGRCNGCGEMFSCSVSVDVMIDRKSDAHKENSNEKN